jgi:L-gulonolactone oxidase
MSKSTSKNLATMPLHSLYRLLQPITLPPSSPRARFTNWGQTYTCTPLVVFEPETEYQCELILELARREGQVVRAVGVGHSPSDLACTRGYLLRTDKLNAVVEVRLDLAFRIPKRHAIVGNLRRSLPRSVLHSFGTLFLKFILRSIPRNVMSSLKLELPCMPCMPSLLNITSQ